MQNKVYVIEEQKGLIEFIQLQFISTSESNDEGLKTTDQNCGWY